MAQVKKLGELLVEQEVITPEQLTEALQKQAEYSLPLGETVIEMELVAENVLLKILGRHLNVDFLNIAENDYQVIDRSLVDLLPRDTCERLRIVPVFLVDDGVVKRLTVAMSDPLNTEAIKEIETDTGAVVSPVLTTSSGIAGGIERLFEAGADVVLGPDGYPIAIVDETIKYVNRLLAQAVQMGASDIHIEPHAQEVHVRLRIDGVLRVFESFPLPELGRIIVRIKNMGSEKQSLMRIDERRVPQDGSFARVIGGHGVDFRVATFPTIYGEKIALRVFDKDRMESVQRIHDLKMPPRLEREFIRCIRQNSGIIIATGPTGSGKTTTLHTVINHVNDVGLNIVTVEDPVEYHAADYVNQSSVKRQAGYTYPVALRSIIRQDPDVILIGEIRDLETAEIAVQAALTGHRVLTTLHTDDAAGAVVRLVDLGIEQFLVSSTVVSAINQRLLRKVCPDCREEHRPSMEDLVELAIDENIAEEIVANQDRFKISQGLGCKTCHQTGYLGRQGAFELLVVTPTIKKLILERETSDIIAEKARIKEDVNMIFEDGLRLALTGITSLEELRRVPRGDYPLRPIQKIFEVSGDTTFPWMF
jgi:type IV pilus assembly protein PilB